MSNKQDYKNNCFSPNWIEVDLAETDRNRAERSEAHLLEDTAAKKEARLESRRRKDLNTLLKELDEIKQNIERVAEKQRRLASLSSFYSDEFA